MWNVVVIPSQGFANRMRMIASAYIFAKKMKKELYVCWNATEHCNININTIFDKTSMPFKCIDESEITNKKYFFQGHVHTNNIMNNILELKDDYDYVILLGGHEFIHPAMTLDEYIYEKHKFYENLIYSDIVNNRLNKISLPDKYIGLHYRDVVDVYDKKDIEQSSACAFNKNSPYNKFIELLKKIDNKSLDYVVISNNTNVQKLLSDTFPDKTFHTSGTTLYERNEEEYMIHAICDFYIISRSEFIIGTYQSSFSDEASYLKLISKVMPLSNHIVTSNNYHCVNYKVKNQLGFLNYDENIYIKHSLFT